MEINMQRVEDAIIAEVSDKLIGDDGIYDQVKRAVDDQINKIFTDRANAQIANAINDAIKSGFDREYQKVDSFGTKVGEPTTIRKELDRMVSGYWNTIVDKQGNPTSGYGEKMTRAEWVMSQIVVADFNSEIKQHVVNAAGQFKDGLRASLHETVNELLSEVFKVKSLGDQGLNRTGDAIIRPAAK